MFKKSALFITLTFFLIASYAKQPSEPIEQQASHNPSHHIDNNVKLHQDEPKTVVSEKGVRLTVHIVGLKEEKLLDNAQAYLSVFQEQQSPIANASYAQYLVDAGEQEIKDSLKPFGYYRAEVNIQQQQKGDDWQITYRVKKGQAVRVKTLDILLKGQGKSQQEFIDLLKKYPLKVGDILTQPDYSDFKSKMTALATTYGYFDANFSDHCIVLSEDLRSADILLTYDTGRRYTFGKTTIQQDFLDDDVLYRFISYRKGDDYSAKKIADVQRDFYNSNYIKMIDVSAEPNKTNQRVPVVFSLTPKKNKKHTFSIGYGTDTGVRAKYDFDWRWVNRRGHQFNLAAYASQRKQELGGVYRIPAEKPATDYYKIFAKLRRIDDSDKESLMWNLGGAYHDQVGHWQREFGIKWQQEDFTLGYDKGNIGLLTPYIALTYRKVDDPLKASRGFFLQTTVTGAHQSALSDVSFLQAVANAKVLRKFGDKNKVKLSGAIGKNWVADYHKLPATYRFFTGGDRTIRGYRFESIGQRDGSNENIGGDKMYFASLEYEYFFKENMAAAAFVDAGDAFSSNDSKVKIGAGLGFHYYSPIGPIRIDVGHGFNEPGDKFRLHLNIGPEL